jgi:hypothetical protein
MRSQAAVVALIMALAIGCGFLFGKFVPRSSPPAAATINTATVIRQIQTLSELVTVKYVLEKVVILEDVKWYGENRLLLLAHGIVKAGIDLGELRSEDIVVEGKKITLTLPMERITDAYLDDKKTGVIERSTGLVRQVDKDLEQTARRQAVEDIRRAARQNGILLEARQRAELQVKTFLEQAGFEEVQFKSPYK